MYVCVVYMLMYMPERKVFESMWKSCSSERRVSLMNVPDCGNRILPASVHLYVVTPRFGML